MSWLALSCGGGGAKVKSGEQAVALISDVKLGASMAEARVLHPGLEPSGMEGTFLDARSDPLLEIELTADKVSGVRISASGEVADAYEGRLRDRLGPGRDCSPLPSEVQGFRSTLWQLPDGTGVSVARMLKQLRVRVVRPADATFSAAFTGCHAAK